MLKKLAVHAAAIALPIAAAWSGVPAAQAQHRLTGPVVHDNLAIYFVHGASREGAVPLTLQEALAAGKVAVHETGTVSRLDIENTSDEEVFVQAGDIVKGGRQDRVLTVSLLLAPKSGRLPIGAYCVERGRWAARGKEDVARFSSADKSLPSREAKLALLGKPASGREQSPPAAAIAGDTATGSAVRRPPAGQQAPAQIAGADRTREDLARLQAQLQRAIPGGVSAQGAVWDSVASTQRKLSENLRTAIAAGQSASSLQLSLENQKLAEARAAYVAKIKAAGEAHTDVIGFVVAINGKLSSAELYPSNGLFRKMWSKQLDAGATEAIGEKSAQPAAAAPALEAALAFLTEAEQGKPTTVRIDADLSREAREAERALLVETRRGDGRLVHRSYIAKK